MVLNVDEWCWDWYAEYDLSITVDPKGPLEGEQLIYKGGSCAPFVMSCRVARRGKLYGSPSSRNTPIGFRLCRTIDKIS